MQLLNSLSFSLIFLTGAYFFCFGILSIFRSNLAARFLLGFATTAKLHYLELLIRLAIGAALIQYGPAMLFANLVEVFAWTLIGTTTCIIIVPWRLHHRFAQKFVPYANRYLKPIGVISISLGVSVWTSLGLFQ